MGLPVLRQSRKNVHSTGVGICFNDIIRKMFACVENYHSIFKTAPAVDLKAFQVSTVSL